MSAPCAELIAVGSELLDAWHTDTNGAYLSRRLGERGIAVRLRLGLSMPPRNRRQAMVPRAAEILPNRLGTAPGLRLQSGSATIVLLPGVPDEMRQIFEDSVMPRLPDTGERFAYRVIKIAGLTESDVDRRLDPVARDAGAVAWTILAAPGQVEIHLRERVRGAETPAGIDR